MAIQLSLFSKWLSESGELVQKIFANISEMANKDDVFLVILLGRSSSKRVSCFLRRCDQTKSSPSQLPGQGQSMGKNHRMHCR